MSRVQVVGNRIQVIGLRDLSRELTAFGDKDLNKEFGDELKQAVEPVADVASRMAPRRTGQYADSFKVTGGRAGVYLRSTDPTGPYKEFMHRPPQGQGLTARWGTPARAAFPAIEQEIDNVAHDLGVAVDRVLDRIFARFTS